MVFSLLKHAPLFRIRLWLWIPLPRLDLQIDGKIAQVTFNNPAARNALTWSMYKELKQICDSLTKNGDVRAVIFREAGDKAFVSGSDIQQFVNLKENEVYEVAVNRIFASLQQLPMPTIAMIEGLAVGSGLLVVGFCDFRISTPEARFGIPVAKTLGNRLSPMARHSPWCVYCEENVAHRRAD